MGGDHDPTDDEDRDGREGPSGSGVTVRRIALGAVVALLVAYLVAVPFGAFDEGDRLSATEAAMVGIILLGLLLSSQQTYLIRSLSIGSGGVSAQLERVEARQAKLESEVRALQIALSGIVSKFELVHLRKLAETGPVMVHFGWIMVGELTRLDAMGFVRPVDSGRGLNALALDRQHEPGDFDLRSYVDITREGREYVALRARLSDAAAPPEQDDSSDPPAR